MLLAIDAGNTNITIAVFEKEKMVASFRLTTKIPRTSDEYGLLMLDLLAHNKIDATKIDSVVIASVVPNIMHSLNNGITHYLKTKPLILGPGTKTGIKLTSANPHEIGADRIADVVGAYEIYGGPLIVVDFGTATTYDFVTADGTFATGITCPGIRTAAQALWQNAAQIPEIEIKKPTSIMAKDTVTSIQAGLVYGCIGQTEYIIDKIKEEAGIPGIKTVATGGLGKIIADATNKIDIYDSGLTLHGLRLIYNKNKK
ncbi:type III pantothenate kinase [Parasporobacterium paucivorans]|uniref:Type III pantothenate kinase n=1 Tax=Parasporobacterium paucivorans DSM 15970 TaxID=1122934 RepID=A0A1M6JS07_9FIRM|nr:type III pantothenate kinase [Parasporobacterium paucivorans]SHJ49436.1 pantothenate kinase [Parasporobacterium paucivorans DSM 15970]